MLTLSSILLLRNRSTFRSTALDRHQGFVESLALALPLAVLLGILIAVIDATALEGWPSKENPFASLRTWQSLIHAAALGLFVMAVTVLIRRNDARCWLSKRLLLSCRYLSCLNAGQALVLIVSVIGILISLAVWFPSHFSKILGPIGVMFLFLSLFCVTVSLLTFIYDRYQTPIISALVIAALLWSHFSTNDNHHIRLLSNADPTDAPTAFLQWLRNRPDLSEYEGRPYPVYIVSAEGGGLYAAVHTAQTLARIQDNCPIFARHVFAISAVSGGSLGAALFSALVKTYPPLKNLAAESKCRAEPSPSGDIQSAVQTYFREDFLTPLLAAGLFPDFFQRFWPFKIDVFDRAKALEDKFADAWERSLAANKKTAADRKNSPNVFLESQRVLWSAEKDQPALLLNSTLVHSGERVIIAPFMLGDLHHEIFPDRYVDQLNENVTVPLATAVSVSARFPVVTPPAVAWGHERWGSAQLVDGGYYENSGISTAMNLIDRIRSLQTSPLVIGGTSAEDSSCPHNNRIEISISPQKVKVVCIKIITIRAATESATASPYGDVLSAVPAFYQTRIAKGIMNIVLSYRLFCGGENCGLGEAALNPHIYVKTIDTTALKLPLGWYLSARSLEAILAEGHEILDCRAGSRPAVTEGSRPRPFVPPTPKRREQENQCLYTRIKFDLVGD